MYGLAQDADLTFFVNRQLLQVCLGPHQVIVKFDGRVSINSSSTMQVSVSTGAVRSDDPRVLGPALLGLLTDTVTGVQWSTDGTIRLAFAGGGSLQLVDDASPFESYEIQHGEGLIVV